MFFVFFWGEGSVVGDLDLEKTPPKMVNYMRV